MNTAALVIPCYNEADRLNTPAFLDYLSANPDVHYLFVNDGSKDETKQVLNELCERAERAQVLHMEFNCGKAEAVRQGMVECSEQSFDYVGYWDADLTTPLEELPRFLSAMDENNKIEIVSGARVKMVGREIERNPFRHYSGRIFATFVSFLLGISMYDTNAALNSFGQVPRSPMYLNCPSLRGGFLT